MWTREYVFGVFLDAVRHVWRNADFVLPHISMSEEQPDGKVLASLAYAGRPKSIGSSLLQRADHYTLRMADALLDKTDEQIRKVMIHEAVHLGIQGHGQEFRKLVIEKGGVVSGAGVDSGGGIKLEEKRPGRARYETVMTFEPHEEYEAQRMGKELANKLPGSRFRLTFGGA